ncbi:MAG: beta-ketoacyl synthase N-terminal-like domain-containing protein, partial [bacterium]
MVGAHENGAAPIAIIGIGCRFPGGISHPTALWDALQQGLDLLGPAPERVGLDPYYHPVPQTPGRVCSREGGFLTDVEGFDAEF